MLRVLTGTVAAHDRPSSQPAWWVVQVRAVPPVGKDGRLLLPQAHVEAAVAQVGHWQGVSLHGLYCLEDAPVRELCKQQLAHFYISKRTPSAQNAVSSWLQPLVLHQGGIQSKHHEEGRLRWSLLHVCSKLTIRRACVLLAGSFGLGCSHHLLLYKDSIHLYPHRGHSSPGGFPAAPCLLGSWR